MLFPFHELDGVIWRGIPLISDGAKTITPSPSTVQPAGKFPNERSIIATSFPVFSIHAVGHEDTPSLTFQLSFESTVIPDTEPTLTGTCSMILPLPSPFEICILTVPTSSN